MPQSFRINLGGEGEVPGVINQQGAWVLEAGWHSARHGLILKELIAAGHAVLIADNLHLPIPDGIVDVVFTNGVPIDQVTWLGSGVQSAEIKRILKSGGRWIDDGALVWTQP